MTRSSSSSSMDCFGGHQKDEAADDGDTLELLKSLKEINQCHVDRHLTPPPPPRPPRIDDKKISKRQEQNRAAQRAFRQRKRDHLGELDTIIKKLKGENERCYAEIQRLNEIVFIYKEENSRLSSCRTKDSNTGSNSANNEFCEALSDLLDDNRKECATASSSSRTQLSFSPSQLWTITPIDGEGQNHLHNHQHHLPSLTDDSMTLSTFQQQTGLKDSTKDPEMYIQPDHEISKGRDPKEVEEGYPKEKEAAVVKFSISSSKIDQ